MAKVRIKRGTRAQIEAAAALGALVDGEPYLITDERRIAVGVGAGAFSAMATQEEVETFANVAIRTPSNALPLNMATGVDPDEVTLTGSAYNSLRGNAMAALHVQISTAPDFIAKLIDTGDIAGSSTSYAVALNALPGLSEIYWRVRYKDVAGEYSAWSVHTSFVTAKRAGDYIATPTATPSAFGDPLDGGFYAGMIWNELTESSTSTDISTGEKTFVVSDMSVVPLVYHGQTLEIRSRANPANKMTGTVVSAIGTSLKISVTAVGGGGSFADWSIMSRFRVVVAPKASGQNNSVVYKNTATAAPVACKTLSEGFKATVSMAAADSATVYPAAHWARNLRIGGRDDWYIPARDELELCWRNLKPTIDANYTGGRDDSSINYQTRGSFDDNTTAMGSNRNSSPEGAPYTGSNPTQTSATAFRFGGAESFDYGADYYLSSSEYSDSQAWIDHWYTGYAGYQYGARGKNLTCRARAVRRSII